jgi:hypothetical protein
MERSNAVRREQKVQLSQDTRRDRLQDDARWQLAQRVVSGTHFARSPLLSKFLLYVVAETLKGREAEITEHQIGVQVFDRRQGYSTAEDNIVRSYARQLRKRLAEFFASEGCAEPLRIGIPLGGYVPVFVRASEDFPIAELRSVPVSVTVHTKAAGELDARQALTRQAPAEEAAASRSWRRWPLGAAGAVAYSAALVSITWLAAAHIRTPQPTAAKPAHALWAALFDGQENTYIVPADAGFNLLEDLSRRPIQLADYINGNYLKLPLTGVDAHSADDLRSQHFTSFVDSQTVAALSRLPEFDPQRAFLRFPRDLRLADLKNANAILIGSVGSNPWSSIADSTANFHIVYGEGMQDATIINAKPQPGEAASYASHWSEPAHETFALIAFLPNLGGTGHLLLLQGLDVAGTEAAAETLFHQDAIAAVLRRAIRPDGSLRHFEILLRSTSIESNSTGTQVIATRIY